VDAEVHTVGHRVALQRRPRELGALRDAELAEADRTAGRNLLREIDRLHQLDGRMSDHRSNPDGPAFGELHGDVRLNVDRSQRRLLRGEPSGKLVAPLRGEAVRHVRTEPVRETATRAVVHEHVRYDGGGNVGVVSLEGRVLREVALEGVHSSARKDTQSWRLRQAARIPVYGRGIIARRAGVGERATECAGADLVQSECLGTCAGGQREQADREGQP
jgi:hypothetical protein